MGNLNPDLTILLDIDTSVGLNRARKRQGEPDRIEKGRLSFHQRVREGYLEVARTDSKRVKVTDADKDIKSVDRAVRGHIDNFLKQISTTKK